tara:strand:+ start:1613 stop:2032 length:420 start_codon:yes stop_codon:yes gene_type:complete
MAKSRRVGKQPNDLTKDLRRAANKALDAVVPLMDREFTVQIQSKVWGWPKETKRKNGSTAETIRDIVDTGELMRSQKNSRIKDTVHRFIWDVEYSSVVHNGANLKQGGNYPGRPWTQTAEKEVNPQKRLSDIISRELDG